MQFYSAAMIAELTAVPLVKIRRWQRWGWIIPTTNLHGLPHFLFEEITVVQRLRDLLANGVSEAVLKKKIRELPTCFPHVARPLLELSLQLRGGKWLHRTEDMLQEITGQIHFDFESLSTDDEPVTLLHPLVENNSAHKLAPETLREQAEAYEAEGEWDLAAQWYRATLLAWGPKVDVNLQLADCLFRLGDLTAARERYCMVLELEEQHVEARLNLGCIYAELHQPELAIATLQGVLTLHAEYADAHFHLAKLLDTQQRPDEAKYHWQQFLLLSPHSPWAEIAESHLQDSP